MTALHADLGNEVDFMLMWATISKIRRRPMTANDYVRARIDPVIKNEAAAVLAKMGLRFPASAAWR